MEDAKRGKRFRCPARNEWDRVAPQFEAMARSAGRDGVMARMMLEFMPVLCDVVERERDRLTASPDFFDGIAAVAGAMIEEAIEQRTIGNPYGRPAMFDQALQLINRVVRPRLAGAASRRLIVPEY